VGDLFYSVALQAVELDVSCRKRRLRLVLQALVCTSLCSLYDCFRLNWAHVHAVHVVSPEPVLVSWLIL